MGLSYGDLEMGVLNSILKGNFKRGILNGDYK